MISQRRKRVFRTLSLLALMTANTYAASDTSEVTHLCPHLLLVGKLDPGLNDIERGLVCGDKSTDAWKTIPYTQAKFNLKNFLQERGDHHPVFSSRADTGFFSVDVGEKTRITTVTLEGG